MSAPLFSIGIPNYERPDTLREALHNIFAQTFQDFEVIVSDDSSNANIEAVISEFNDPRLRWVQQEKKHWRCRQFQLCYPPVAWPLHRPAPKR